MARTLLAKGYIGAHGLGTFIFTWLCTLMSTWTARQLRP